MLSLFYLVGPTAVGKTALAVEIAERCGAEIVSADAFQVYRGLDVLTAKPSAEQLHRVRHHLIGCVPLESEYNVARFSDDARQCLEDISSRGRPALVVGGNGLYIRALTHGLSPLPPASPELRATLQDCDVPCLLARLQILDPAAIPLIDTQNKRRLIRAIEICETSGSLYSATRDRWQRPEPTNANGIFLVRDRFELKQRIDQRADAMVAEGAIDEVASYRKTMFSATSKQIIGLTEIDTYLREEIDLQGCLQNIKTKTSQYAKRQMTWFRNKAGFTIWNLSEADAERLIEHAVRQIMASDGTSNGPVPIEMPPETIV